MQAGSSFVAPVRVANPVVFEGRRFAVWRVYLLNGQFRFTYREAFD